MKNITGLSCTAGKGLCKTASTFWGTGFTTCSGVGPESTQIEGGGTDKTDTAHTSNSGQKGKHSK